MKTKTRKLIWSAPLMATLAVVGALAVFVALGLPNPQQAEAVERTAKSIATQTVFLGTAATPGTLDVSAAFDTDIGESVTYAAKSSNATIATVGFSTVPGEEGIISITPVALGETDITVTATNDSDSTDKASAKFKVVVTGVAMGTAPDAPIYVAAGSTESTQAAAKDGEWFGISTNVGPVYSATSSDTSVATVSISSFTGAMDISGKKAGKADITVKAHAPMQDSYAVSQKLTVVVAQADATDTNDDADNDDDADTTAKGTLYARSIGTLGSTVEVPRAELALALPDAVAQAIIINAESSDPMIATVQASGTEGLTVTGVANGSVVITFTSTARRAEMMVTVGTGPTEVIATPSETTFSSSSTSGGAGVDFKLVVNLSDGDVEKLTSDGGSIELYLEDDFVVPGSIDRNDVYFTVAPKEKDTGDGGRVRVRYGVVINDGDFYGGGDDWAIQVFIPDLQETVQSSSMTVGAGFQGPTKGDTITMVVTASAGIKNSTEAGDHSVDYRVLGVNDDAGKGTAANIQDVITDSDADPVAKNTVMTVAKIKLSHGDGGRDKEVTITGSGFNNDVSAQAFVMSKVEIAGWWNTLNCAGMKAVMGSDSNRFCFDFDKMTGDLSDTVEGHSDFKALSSSMQASYVDMVRCRGAINEGQSLGTENVGTDHSFAIAFTVHQDEFKPGNVNYICAEDAEAGNPRQASAVKVFNLTASISLDPAEANSGDEVTLKARDFGGPLTSISLGPNKTWTADASVTNAFPIKEITNNNMDYTFEVPGGLSGVIQVDAKRGTIRKTDDLTITPSSLMLSVTEVAPNQSIVISGSGFSERAKIYVKYIKIDGKMLAVDDAGTEGTGDDRHVVTTSSGQFTVTVNVWHDDVGNPALDDGEYTIKVEDENGYEGKTKITILEPTVMVTPLVAGPRDFITISGANWPVTTSDLDHDVDIMLDDKTRSASIDSTGRFNYQYQLSGGIDIGTEHEIVVMFTTNPDIGDIEEKITFSVPSSDVVITPAAAAPGQTIDLEISGMPIYERVTEVVIDGGNRLGGTVVNTDRNGDVTITGIVIPFADPGFYPVKIVVGTGGSAETAIIQLEILAEPRVTGTATALPGALSELGDNLVRVFHFNNANKSWTFYDPRPDFEDLNTLTELAAGQPYWVLVSEGQENVVLNGQTRNLTCSGGDCWNLEVW